MEQDAGCKVSTLKVDGGASNNNYLCQTQADISDTTVIRPACVETTALGAAYLAGLAVGYYKSLADIVASKAISKKFKPGLGEKERKEKLAGWHRAVKATAAFHE
jgi:glycerol kinase